MEADTFVDQIPGSVIDNVSAGRAGRPAWPRRVPRRKTHYPPHETQPDKDTPTVKRANLYALFIVTTLLLLFCLAAAAAANAQETGNDESIVTHLGELVDELFARVDKLDERITGIEDADQQDELWDTVSNLDLLVGDPRS